MTATVEEYLSILNEKAAGHLRGTARIVFDGLGSFNLDENGARVGDDPADITLTAKPEVFEAIFDGKQNPMMAFMSGKLKVDGSNMRAIKVGEILTRS